MEPTYKLLLRAASFVPTTHYFLLLALSLLVSNYSLSLFPFPLPSFRTLLLSDDRRDTAAGKRSSCIDVADYSPAQLVIRAALLLPASTYLLTFAAALLCCVYRLTEVHLLDDLFTGLRGHAVNLIFHPHSPLYHSVVSRCRILRGRYLGTPWLASPHLQTAFMSFFGRPPVVSYTREIFNTSDGGTVALDWLRSSDVLLENVPSRKDSNLKDDKAPIVVVIPGLGSDSLFPYIKHLAIAMAKHRWNVCVSNHRGFGGVPMTADRVCNAGWTQDNREVINHIHRQYPEASIYAVGTSVGANLLVKYLGEEGVNVPLAGAAAVCCPWDLQVFDRFLNRSFMQKIYDKAITIALQCHAEEHQPVFSRLADYKSIQKARSLREYYYSGARLMGNFKTVDGYYRHSSSAGVVGNVAVPLLCINALDDPVCSCEAIPWEECRANKNIVLATTTHGGHIAHYEGLSANSMWWVRAVDEFLGVLHSSQIIHQKKMQIVDKLTTQEPSLDWDSHSHTDITEKKKKDREGNWEETKHGRWDGQSRARGEENGYAVCKIVKGNLTGEEIPPLSHNAPDGF